MRISFIKKSHYLLFIAAFISSCAVQLATSYDVQLKDDLSELNKGAQTYFEAMSGNVAAKKFEDHEQTYNELIGLTQSLITQSESRPVPDSKAVSKINSFLQAKGKPIWDPNNNLPSTVALTKIKEDLQKLKAIHEDGSINTTKYELRQNSINLYLEQAIVFENALER
jgi:hypothetical protein